jgi:hypothetical protein
MGTNNSLIFDRKLRRMQVHMQSYIDLQNFLESQRARHQTVTEESSGAGKMVDLALA